MLKRLFAIMLLAVIPLAARADDNAAPAPTAAAIPTPAETPPQSASASPLGPTTTPVGGSSADSAALQPAGTTPLQSTTSNSTGLAASNQQALQAPATSDALKVLAAEADGAPHPSIDNPDSPWSWLWYTLALAVLTGLTYVALRRPRLAAVIKRFGHRLRGALPKRH